MRRQGRESAAGNLIPKSDYPKTGYYSDFELSDPRHTWEENLSQYYCRSCGASVAQDASFCSGCGNPLSSFAAPSAGKPATRSFRREGGSQGLLLGVAGICLGILGIFTFGWLFVPLAVLASLFGLLRGITNRATSGMIASIVGLTLSAVGFFVSPSLMLLTGSLLGASQTATDHPPTTSPGPVAKTASQLPERETKFCDLTGDATQTYFDQAIDAAKARMDKNGIVATRVEDAMSATVRDRNANVLKFARETNFGFDDWGVKILKVDIPYANHVSFSVRPVCSPIVTIHLTAPADPQIIEALSNRRAGDMLLVSGTFVGSRLDRPDAVPVAPNDKKFEQSTTERGSMEEPEYWAQLRY
jgi:hypothetical protein